MVQSIVLSTSSVQLFEEKAGGSWGVRGVMPREGHKLPQGGISLEGLLKSNCGPQTHKHND